jgi:23S rRNA pseudouridine1911/1915/1917 synthase
METIRVTNEQAGRTLAALLRVRLPGQSWNAIRKLVAARRVRVGSDLCLDPTRRLEAGDEVHVADESAPPLRLPNRVRIRYLDEHLVVVEKPAGLSTVRHPAERDWSEKRRSLSPTLDDIALQMMARQENPARSNSPRRLRIVHRLDKETSGLVVFARTVEAERGLGQQFHAHTVTRLYQAIVPGYLSPRRIATCLVRDRGDGRRGSSLLPGQGKEAITHVSVLERLPKYTLLSCRLETGRTHQIRIQLADAGHPICGERVYNRRPNGTVLEDRSAAPRLALHAAELGFVHPTSGKYLHWSMPLPEDLAAYLERLRNQNG